MEDATVTVGPGQFLIRKLLLNLKITRRWVETLGGP